MSMKILILISENLKVHWNVVIQGSKILKD